ncbi:hypothetical protein ACLMAJ_29125 [Nocardia sp. KC 131]
MQPQSDFRKSALAGRSAVEVDSHDRKEAIDMTARMIAAWMEAEVREAAA